VQLEQHAGPPTLWWPRAERFHRERAGLQRPAVNLEQDGTLMTLAAGKIESPWCDHAKLPSSAFRLRPSRRKRAQISAAALKDGC